MSPTYYPNLPAKIFFVDIGKPDNTDLVRWKGKNSKIFLLDILTCRKNAAEEYFLHFEKSNHRMAYIKKEEIVFLICADQTVQYQLLEAILEQIMVEFFEGYGEIVHDPILLSGMVSSFTGFMSLIPPTFEKALKTRIKWLSANCKICEETKAVCIKKSLISNAKSFPVSLVFEHEGHGLLLYIDRHFRLRGHEIVEISG